MEDTTEEEMRRIKIVVLGAAGTGKSSLCRQYVEEAFEDAYEPTIEELYTKQLDLCEKSISVTILDTAGQEDSTQTKEEYMSQGDGFVLVYSITDASTFHDIEALYENIVDKKNGVPVPIVLIGNKCDLKHLRSVSTDEAMELVSKMGSLTTYVETSAKECINVDQAFQAMVDLIRRNKPELDAIFDDDDYPTNNNSSGGGSTLTRYDSSNNINAGSFQKRRNKKKECQIM